MANNKFIAVGIGIFGVFAILIAWAAGPADNPEVTQPEVAQDVEDLKPAVAADTSYGTILLPEAISRLEADGANGIVTIEPGKQVKRLPAGGYYVRFWKTERKDDGGIPWAMTGQYYGKNNPFEIKGGGQTRLDVGEPIIATVDARKVGSSYSFNQVIKGRHDEIIEMTRNSYRPQSPKLHIKNKDGSYAKTFRFQYG